MNHWQVELFNKYNITYNLNGGTNSSKNPDGYYITTSTIKLSSPSKDGYTFKGWSEDKNAEEAEYEKIISLLNNLNPH